MGSDKKCTLRTFEGIRELCDAWVADGEKVNSRKDFDKCVHYPLAIFPITGRVIDYCPCLGLHLLLGLGNKPLKALYGPCPEVKVWLEVGDSRL